MKNQLLLSILILLSITSYSQIEVADKSKESGIKAITYDGSFIDFNNMMLTKEQKAGVVGEKITLFKVYTIKNEDGSSVSYKDSEKFENKTFEIIEYSYDYKDVLKIKNDDGVFLIEPSSIDEYVFNSFIDSIKYKLKNKTFYPLKIKSELESLKGDKIEINGLKEYSISDVTFSKLPSGYSIVVEINGEFELVYPTGTFDQKEEKNWINLASSDILKTKTTFIEKVVFSEFSETNKIYLDEIRNGKVKIGMSKKQCTYSLGSHNSSFSNIAGYDTVRVYGNTENSLNLYFKSGVLKLIK